MNVSQQSNFIKINTTLLLVTIALLSFNLLRDPVIIQGSATNLKHESKLIEEVTSVELSPHPGMSPSGESEEQNILNKDLELLDLNEVLLEMKNTLQEIRQATFAKKESESMEEHQVSAMESQEIVALVDEAIALNMSDPIGENSFLAQVDNLTPQDQELAYITLGQRFETGVINAEQLINILQ